MSDNAQKKFAVHYESRLFGKSYIHIFATSAEDAEQLIEVNGIGYAGGEGGGTVFADRITKVEPVEE